MSLGIPHGAKIIDRSAYTILPGMIDCPPTFCFNWKTSEERRRLSQSRRRFAPFKGGSGEAESGSGFTTMRDLDSEGAGFADVAIRDGINRESYPGRGCWFRPMRLRLRGRI